jgi:uncharacterized protein (TIGR03084 family)
MLQQAVDFRDESDSLAEILEPLADGDFESQTAFKAWSLHDVIAHLHMWNCAAVLSLNDADGFSAFWQWVVSRLRGGKSLVAATDEWLEGLKNRALFDAWRDYYPKVAEQFEVADPKARVTWVGPDMSVRSSITARHMETWAHGQEIFDHLGLRRTDADRIRNIAHLGVSTFGWTFKNRDLPIPEDVPFVTLTAPSGARWNWNEPSEENVVMGAASEFCQVVTQVRNIGDTDLAVSGEVTEQWMAIAQCFAGPAETPPAIGTRGPRF